MYQAAPGKPYQEKHITVKGQNLQAVDNFTYLGSTLSRVVYIDAKVNNRIAKTSVAFGSRLCDNVWKLSTLQWYSLFSYARPGLSTADKRGAQSFPPELPSQTSLHHMVGQNS